MNMELCVECGKPCGEALNARGPVTVCHWDCLLEAIRPTREAYQSWQAKTVAAQSGNAWWHKIPVTTRKK